MWTTRLTERARLKHSCTVNSQPRRRPCLGACTRCSVSLPQTATLVVLRFGVEAAAVVVPARVVQRRFIATDSPRMAARRVLPRAHSEAANVLACRDEPPLASLSDDFALTASRGSVAPSEFPNRKSAVWCLEPQATCGNQCARPSLGPGPACRYPQPSQ
jgi:hypothetical protein